MNEQPRDWNGRYLQDDTPWDSGLRSRELARVVKEQRIEPSRAVELGCGTGTNAVFLAQCGFDVTAIDLAPAALEQARAKARAAGVHVTFLEADVGQFDLELDPFDFLFDRGCYHCVRREDVHGYCRAVAKLTRPGTIALILTGSINEQSDEGIPRVHEHEIREELGELFDIHSIRKFHFEDAGGLEGPLGWSCLMTRRGDG